MNIWRELIRAYMGSLPPRDLNRMKVLVIRIDNIGDFVLFSRFLPYFRKRFPNPEYEISLLGNVLWRELAEWVNYYRVVDVDGELYPMFDGFIEFDRKRIKEVLNFYRFLKALRHERFYYVYYPTYSREEWGDIFATTCGAKERVAFLGDLANIREKVMRRNNRKYTRLVECDGGVKSEIGRNARFVEGGLGISMPPGEPPGWVLSEEALAPALTLMREVGLDGVQKFAVVVPGADASIKRWPVERFSDVARYLIESGKVERVVIVGSEREKKFGALMREHLGNDNVLDLTGKTGLPALAGLISRSKLLLSNDTGPLHMAAAFGVPVVCVMGGGHFGRFFPYGDPRRNVVVYEQMDCFGCNWRCIYDLGKEEPAPCLEKISVEKVLEAIEVVATAR